MHDILALKMSHASTVIMNDRRKPQSFQNKLNTQQGCVNFVNHLDSIRVLAILCPVKSKVHALWGLRAAGVVEGRPRGGWPATVVRGVWCQALSLPRPPVLWSGQPWYRDPCVPGAVGAGVGTQHPPHSLPPCGLALLAVGVAEGRPRGGPYTIVRGV